MYEEKISGCKLRIMRGKNKNIGMQINYGESVKYRDANSELWGKNENIKT